MIVESRVVGSREVESQRVVVPDHVVSLRELLPVLVGHELAEYARRRTASRTLRILTPADLARGVDAGAYGRETRELPPPPSQEDAVARALEAFEDGLYFAFLDDGQVEDLADRLAMRPESTLRLVRLVALAGG